MKLEEILTYQERKEVDKLKIQLFQATTRSEINYYSKEIHNILENAEKRYKDPEYKKVIELSKKAALDERSQLEEAGIKGMLSVVRSCLDSGMPIHEIAKHTPFSEEELNLLLIRYHV